MRKQLLFILLFLVWLLPLASGMSLECEVRVLRGAEAIEPEVERDTLYVPNGTLDSVYAANGQVCYSLSGSDSSVCADYPPNTNVVVVRDGEGNQYVVTIYPEPATVEGPFNYIAYSGDSLSSSSNRQVTFAASATQNYGFDAREVSAWTVNYEAIKMKDGENYFVPFKSVGENQTDEVTANIQIEGYDATFLSFKTKSGAVLAHTAAGSNKFKLSVPANAVAVYAWYGTEKLGKLNVKSLKALTRKVVIVPVNNTAYSTTNVVDSLNKTYKQANVSWTATTAQSFTFDLGTDGLEAADATLFSKYSTEMRALRDAYIAHDSIYDKNAYYMFVVPKFTDASQVGYMVRGKGLGFITPSAKIRDIAHELGHGSFGLEHTFPNPPQGSTANLMDYSQGSQLTQKQWDKIHSPMPVISWLDGEEDGAYNSSVHIALTPSGKVFDSFFIKENGKETGVKAALYVTEPYYFVSQIKYNSVYYYWNSTSKCYVSDENAKIFVKANATKPNQVNVYTRNGNDNCNYLFKVIDWSSQDEYSENPLQSVISKALPESGWAICLFDIRNKICEENFIKDIETRESTCTVEKINIGEQLLIQNINNSNPSLLTEVVNSVCLASLRMLSYDQNIKIFKNIASQKSIKDYSEVALLRLMNALSVNDYSRFYADLEGSINVVESGQKVLMSHLVDQMDDAIIPWFNSNTDSYTYFMGALVSMYNSYPSAWESKIASIESEAFYSQVINLNEQSFKDDINDDISNDIIPLNKYRYRGKFNNSTGKVDVYREVQTMSILYVPMPDGSMGRTSSINWTRDETIKNLSPLDPILVTSFDQLPLIHTAIEGVVDEHNTYVIPAIFLQYLYDKEFNDFANKQVMIALDAITIATSGGTALAVKLAFAKRIYALCEVAGAVGNIAVNTGNIDPNSKFGKVIGAYNVVMGAIGVKNIVTGVPSVAKGIINYSKSLPETTLNIIKNNNSIKSFVLASYINWNTAVKNLDGLTSAEKQLINEGRIAEITNLLPIEKQALQSQQKTFKMLGVIDEAGTIINGAGNWLDDIFDMQKSVFNQNKNVIANMSSNHKGAWGEIATDAFLTEKGFQPLHPRKTALTDGWGETGIDGIFKKDGHYYIIEAKYTGYSTLNTSIDGKQLSKTWIEGSSRLENAVDDVIAADIIDKGYRKIWAKVAPDGTITFKEVTDDFATTFIDFTP